MSIYRYGINTPRIDDDAAKLAWRKEISDKLEFSLQGTVRTADATGVTVLAIALQDHRVYGIECWTTGRLLATTGASAIGSMEFHIWLCGVKLNGSGNAQFIGSADHETDMYTPNFSPGPTGPYTTVLTVSGNKLVMNVQGIAGDTVHWQSRMKIFEVGI